MYDEIRKKAERKVKAKKGFYVVAMTFAAVSIILYVISLNFSGWAAYWIKFPILVLALVLAIVYVGTFGLPFSHDWEEKEIEKEMARLYRKEPPALPPPEELSDEERLELKELERLRKKWDPYDDFV